jgi:predicted O-methyltransferase YrrM
MDKAVERVFRTFEKRAVKESERMRSMNSSQMEQHLDEFLLPVGPATGQLMNLLAKESEAKVILEIGSSYGYSTVWLAEAARANGGKVISLEIHPEKQKHARAAVAKAGLDGFVDFRLGDARDLLAKLKGAVDFVLLDLWKDLYIPCFDLFYPRLRKGAFVVADNMTYPVEVHAKAEAYRKHIRKKPHLQSVLLPVGSGIELSRYM